jgi:hypothetical protein
VLEKAHLNNLLVKGKTMNRWLLALLLLAALSLTACVPQGSTVVTVPTDYSPKNGEILRVTIPCLPTGTRTIEWTVAFEENSDSKVTVTQGDDVEHAKTLSRGEPLVWGDMKVATFVGVEQVGLYWVAHFVVLKPDQSQCQGLTLQILPRPGPGH